jgi:hypothetical protein
VKSPRVSKPKQRSASSDSLSARRKQRRNIHSQRIRQCDQLGIRHTTQLGFDLGQGGATQFEAKNGATSRKKLLRQPFLVSQSSDLRADNVLRSSLFLRHAPEMELDNRVTTGPDCSNFGAAFTRRWLGEIGTFDRKQFVTEMLKIDDCNILE